MKDKQANQYIFDFIKNNLESNLYYHGYHHTLDVVNAVKEIGKKEGVSEDDLRLLEVAAYFHDSGFVNSYNDHETHGCNIAREVLPKFDFSDKDIEKICGMIMATKIPQNPKNQLEEIICDADLDYLGREDFYKIGNSLFKEFLAYGVVKNEEDWNKLQVKFLESQHYFTDAANSARKEKKEKHLDEIKKIVATY